MSIHQFVNKKLVRVAPIDAPAYALNTIDHNGRLPMTTMRHAVTGAAFLLLGSVGLAMAALSDVESVGPDSPTGMTVAQNETRPMDKPSQPASATPASAPSAWSTDSTTAATTPNQGSAAGGGGGK